MKNLSFVSLALFLSHLMPVLAVKNYTCGGVVVPAKTIKSEIEKKFDTIPLLDGQTYVAAAECGKTVFEVNPPRNGGSPLSVEIAFNYRQEVMSITATRDNETVDCK
ncbi:putative candidate secreted effector protein [Blumeria hordei DH14]|uniref:Putative candidate secreted effector protein n=1 Tax=Blumeria graminis f. sp. hordei (strain DH14) TaxID=546991 RepID=N1JIX2_BLUG1|nr:putative candidate secreted effector protein [Blumeria hordei DH14]